MRPALCISALIGAMLCSSLAEAIPGGFQKKLRFLTTYNYNQRQEGGDHYRKYEKTCHSVDWSDDPSEGDWFKYCEGIIGSDNLECKYAELKDVRTEPDNSSCVTFSWQGGNSLKYIWKKDTSHGPKMAMASDCAGEPPLDMYMSPKHEGMCGMVSSDYQDTFRYKDDNDHCYSYKLPMSEGKEVKPYCIGRDKTCVSPSTTVEADRITSSLNSGNSANWTCISLSNGNSLWLLDGAESTSAAKALQKSDACREGNAPDVADAFNISTTKCPELQQKKEKNFNPHGDESQCRSFDFTNNMGVDYLTTSFRWCMQNSTVRADCHMASIHDMLITDDNEWYCITFQSETFSGDQETFYYWVQKDGNYAEVTDACDSKDNHPKTSDIYTDTNTNDGRCESGLGNVIKSRVQFQDFDGICHSLDLRKHPTAGGESGNSIEQGYQLYSEFQYCVDGVDNWNGANQHKRECDNKATIEDIFKMDENNDDTFCIKFNSTKQMHGKDHIWIKNTKSPKTVAMSSDCQAEPPIDKNPDRWTTLSVGDDKFCHVLPHTSDKALTGKTMRFWSDFNDDGERYSDSYCHSFKFNPMVVKASERTPGSDNDLFEYCEGSGGRKMCTTMTKRDPNGNKEEPWASIQNFNRGKDSNNDVWYCVEYEYEWEAEMQRQGKVGLWLNADHMMAQLASDCEDQNMPENMHEASNLTDASCPQIPSDAQNQLIWTQGDDKVSVDFSMNPGRGDGDSTRFDYCTHNGHCYPATPTKISNFEDDSDDRDVCVDFDFINDYGLHDHRGVWVNGEEQTAALVKNCEEKRSFKAYRYTKHKMTQRFPGEVQEKFSFWQYGRCVSFDLSNSPNEDNSQFKMCQDVRHNSWCDGKASLQSVVNPPPGNMNMQQNWYCATIKYSDEYDIEDMLYVWMNPHFYEWNKGYAEVVDSHTVKCDWNMFTPPKPNNDVPDNGNYVLRGGKLCNDFFE